VTPPFGIPKESAIRFHAISFFSSVEFKLESHKTGSFCTKLIIFLFSLLNSTFSMPPTCHAENDVELRSEISREVKISKRNVFKKFEKLATCCKPGCFLHSTFVASWQPVKKVGNLIDLSRHVVLDLSGCQPTKKSCELVGN